MSHLLLDTLLKKNDIKIKKSVKLMVSPSVKSIYLFVFYINYKAFFPKEGRKKKGREN